MNRIINDKGEEVVAVGAPGSISRAMIQYPALIEDINLTNNVAVAYTMIKAKGITSRLEAESILMASDHRSSVRGHGEYY